MLDLQQQTINSIINPMAEQFPELAQSSIFFAECKTKV
jgi:hypothetical protein